MSKLHESLVVECPYDFARHDLAARVASAAACGEDLPLSLTAPLPGIELSKTVAVTYSTARDPKRSDQPWHIHWKADSGAYPQFDGELTVRAGETASKARLELHGSYSPPGGALGKAFDVAAGSRIASETAKVFLRRLGDDIEAHYRQHEEAKVSK